jgi:hypothetical protein
MRNTNEAKCCATPSKNGSDPEPRFSNASRLLGVQKILPLYENYNHSMAVDLGRPPNIVGNNMTSYQLIHDLIRKLGNVPMTASSEEV